MRQSACLAAMRGSTFALTLLLVIIAACSPKRDNVNDPINRPAAFLVAGVDSGGRFTTYTFDASGSCEGNCDGFRFAWELNDPSLSDPQVSAAEYEDFDDCDAAIDPATCQAGLSPTLATHLPLNRESVCPGSAAAESCVGEVVRRVRVRVTGPRGGSREADVVVRQGNRAPVADLGADLFVSATHAGPIHLDACGGVARGPGFSCASTDEDADDTLTATWTVLGGAVLPLDGMTADVTPSSTNQPLLVEAVVTDGWASSQARLRVFFGPQAWIGTQSPAITWHFFPDYTARKAFVGLDASTHPLYVGSIAFDTHGLLWIGGATDRNPGTSGNTFVSFFDRQFREQSSWLIKATTGSPSVPSFYPPPAANAGCAIYQDSAGARFVLRLLTAPAGTDDPCSPGPGQYPCARWTPPALEVPVFVFPSPAVPDACRVVTNKRVVDISADALGETDIATVSISTTNRTHGFDGGDGSVWISEIAGQDTTLTRVTAAGAVTGPLLLPGSTITSAVPHPNLPGLFATDSFQGRLVHLAPDLTVTEIPVPLDSGVVDGPLAIDPATRTLWIAQNGAGLLRGFVLGSDGSLSQESEQRIEDVHEGNGAHLWAHLLRDSVGAGLLVHTFASIEEQITLLPAHFQRLTEAVSLRGNAGALHVSPADGSVWLDGDPVEHFSSDGRILASLPNPDGGPAAVDGEGRAWLYQGSAFQRIDPLLGADASVPATEAPRRVAAMGNVLCAVLGTANDLVRIDTNTLASETLTATGTTGYRVEQVAAFDNDEFAARCAFLLSPPSPGAQVLAVFGPAPTVAAVPTNLGSTDAAMGMAIDPRDGASVFIGIWDLAQYDLSGIHYFDAAGASVNLPDETGASAPYFIATRAAFGDVLPAIPLGIKLREFDCTGGIVPGGCIEAFVNLRYNKLRSVKFDTSAASVESVDLPLGETRRLDVLP